MQSYEETSVITTFSRLRKLKELSGALHLRSRTKLIHGLGYVSMEIGTCEVLKLYVHIGPQEVFCMNGNVGRKSAHDPIILRYGLRLAPEVGRKELVLLDQGSEQSDRKTILV